MQTLTAKPCMVLRSLVELERTEGLHRVLDYGSLICTLTLSLGAFFHLLEKFLNLMTVPQEGRDASSQGHRISPGRGLPPGLLPAAELSSDCPEAQEVSAHCSLPLCSHLLSV